MAFRIQLLFVYAVLCLSSLYSVNAFTLFKPAKVEPRIVGFTWSNCGPRTDPDQIISLTVAPDPVDIPGNITVSTSVTLGTPAPTDATLTVLMEAKVAGFWIKVPCVDNVGSCDYGEICTEWAQLCPTYFAKYGIPCTCPIAAHAYSVSDFEADITQKLPISVKGDVRITGNFASASAGHLACLQLELNIKS